MVRVTIEDVLEGRVPRAHIRRGRVLAYVRHTKRWILNQYVETLDVASIEVPESLQGKGHGTRFLSYVEKEAHKRGLSVFVESILNERFYESLVRRAYVPCHPMCLCLPPKNLT